MLYEAIINCFSNERFLATIITSAIFLSPGEPVFAQAPANDVVSWPAGLLLLASILYAALGTAPDQLFEIEPAAGYFMWSGLPKVPIPAMKRVNWVAEACHFVPGIRSAHGISNFWVRAEEVTAVARSEALKRVLSVLHCVLYKESSFNKSLWTLTTAGLVHPADVTVTVTTPENKPPSITPSAHDFLLFAAIDYHVFREWEVQVHSKGAVVFSTKEMLASSVIDVESDESAIPVVATQMVRRPHSQSPLRGLAHREGDDERGPYIIDIDNIPKDTTVCSIDFHSYAPEASKVSATLNELAGAYYRVVQYLKNEQVVPGQVAWIDVGQTLWIAILGGAILDKGRFTIQNLPGRWAMSGVSADEAYLTRVDSILEALEPHARKSSFFDIVFSGGINRRSAYPFFIAGLFGQVILCYFLSVGTSAGVWTSVVLANTLYAGRLTDWHSMFYGKMVVTEEPGMKMYVPGSKELMAIATFDRSTPRQGRLRPGLFLNMFGLIGAILGAVFQRQTRNALGFRPYTPTPAWVVYTSVALCIATSLLIATSIMLQQMHEKTWPDDSELPMRWMVYTTLPVSLLISGLAVYFLQAKLTKFWPVLDALTWLSGIPLGMLENGRIFSADANTLHLVLLNRWIMGAVASAVGSHRAGRV